MPNKVTPEHIATIMKERVTVSTVECDLPTKHTIATAWLDGSFALATDISKAVDPANYDSVLGIKYSTEGALAKAEEALWQLEGYVLYSRLKG